MRLIDADALLDAIEDKEWVHITDYNIALYTVKDAPTVDAVPVVRCKYCEHHECYGGNIVLFCHRHGMMVAPDYYCGDGNGGEQHE